MKNRIELHAKSKYSMDHESTLDIKNLILKCAANGDKGVAIVDTNSIHSFLKSEKILKELQVKDFKLIHGVLINASHNSNLYQVIILVKNKEGISKLNRLLSPYWTLKSLPLIDLVRYKEHFLLGLPLMQENYEEILPYMDYVEVDKTISKKELTKLKKSTIVVYSDQPNALDENEELSKKILYSKFHKKEDVSNRLFKNTKETMEEFNDQEIVIENPRKIFAMIEQFQILDDKPQLIEKPDFAIDLLVYISLNEKYGDNIPKKIKKRVDEELRLIREYQYEGYINLYKKITDRCKDQSESYVIGDYISYLYVAYLLGITHFDPIKMGLNYDFFFSNKPTITLYVSDYLSEEILKYVKNTLGINTIRCKGLIKMSNYLLKRAIKKYEQTHAIKLSKKEVSQIQTDLLNYPLNNRAIHSSELIIPESFDIYELSPREILGDGHQYSRFINVDYKDIESIFIRLDLLSNDKINILNELKDLTRCEVQYKDKSTLHHKDFKTTYVEDEDALILDDLYTKLIEKGVEYPVIFNIINEIKQNQISSTTKQILLDNEIMVSNEINHISKGIYLEKLKLEYDLIYYKEHFPLEYYYVMLKDCPFYPVLDVVRQGYKSVIKKLDEYSKERYEYYYLNVVRDLYESDVDFQVEERMIIDKYCFELDKENDCLLLLVNKTDLEISSYLDCNLSVIGTRPINGKMPYMANLLYRLLESNKTITLFGLDGKTNFYLDYLLMRITGIDHKIISQYLNPCSCYKDDIFDIDQQSYMYGLDYLLYHDLSIKDYYSLDTATIESTNSMADKILWMIQNSASEIIIIDNPIYLDINPKNFFKQLKTIAKKEHKHIIIFINLNHEYESNKKKEITAFPYTDVLSKQSDYITILDGENLTIINKE